MTKRQPFVLCLLYLLLLVSCTSQHTTQEATSSGITGELITIPNFSSSYVDSRDIFVWLPPSYHRQQDKRYPVIYMHDGQNLFDPKSSYSGVDWGVDERMTDLIASGTIHEAIVVGIANTPKRIPEYIPLVDTLADQYLKFIVKEVKPYIDAQYRSAPNKKNTFIMGSSAGGLISMYGIALYPNIFGGAACVSTHWPAYNFFHSGGLAQFIRDNPLSPTEHRIYFSYGTKGLDALYEPGQQEIDQIFTSLGFLQPKNWLSLKFDGHDHNEQSWSDQLHEPLTFLLKK